MSTIYMNAAANVVFDQLSNDPLGPGVFVDPDVADSIGVEQLDFPVDACGDDDLLKVNEKGEVFYDEA